MNARRVAKPLIRIVRHGRFSKGHYRLMPRHWRDELVLYRIVALLHHAVLRRQHAVTLG